MNNKKNSGKWFFIGSFTLGLSLIIASIIFVSPKWFPQINPTPNTTSTNTLLLIPKTPTLRPPTAESPTLNPKLYNIAPEGTIQASSTYPSSRNCFDPKNVVDGSAIEVYDDSVCHAWASNYEGVGTWIMITFDRARRVSRIVLYDRPSPPRNEHVLDGKLEFSDDSMINTGPLPDNGTPLVINFQEKTIKWVRFTVLDFTGQNIGLSEFEIFGM